MSSLAYTPVLSRACRSSAERVAVGRRQLPWPDAVSPSLASAQELHRSAEPEHATKNEGSAVRCSVDPAGVGRPCQQYEDRDTAHAREHTHDQ